MDKHKSIIIHEVSFEAGNYMYLTGCIPTIPVSKDENGNIVYGKRMSAPNFFWNCTKAMIANERKKAKIQTAVEMCQDFGKTITEAVALLMEKFSLTESVSRGFVDQYWKT